jgi:hypothetical protein
MQILAAIPPDATRAILECLELPPRAPPTAPARNDMLDKTVLPGDDEFGA